MIRKIIFALVVLTCLVVPSAFARPGDIYRPYLTIGGGYTLVPDTDVNNPGMGNEQTIISKDGYNFVVATGLAYDVGRVEFSISHHRNNFDEREFIASNTKGSLDGYLAANTFLLSIYYDFNKDGAISPYFGGGVGISQLRLKSVNLTNGDDNATSFQLCAGVSLNLGENTQFDLGYKLLGISEADLGSTNQEQMYMNNATLALRFLF